MPDQLKQALAQGLLRNIDYFFARQIAAIDAQADENLALLAALTSSSVGTGNVCLELESVAGKTLRAEDNDLPGVVVAPLTDLETVLKNSAVVAAPGEHAPLILDSGNRLYLGRYWWYEQRVAEALRERQQAVEEEHLDTQKFRASLSAMFPPQTGETDWQMVAAVTAVLQRFAVISGGPGTGKTHTVTSILALLIEQAAQRRLNIALAAPTGKAAARLSESIRKVKPEIACSPEITDLIPEQASTIHRLIGIRPGSAIPVYHAENPLTLDLLVVDEASMIDLPLMARLLAALPPQARVILLGDKDQLSSVEAGSVFADISGDGTGAGFSTSFSQRLQQFSGQEIEADQINADAGFADCVVQLRKSYRFDPDSGIGALATAINQGDSQSVLQLLERETPGLTYLSPQNTELEAYINAQLIPAYARCFSADSVQDAIEQFNSLRILCALRKTAAGVEAVNHSIENSLKRNGLIRCEDIHYQGRPILITRNDHNLGLFNGDMGILWPDPEADGQLRAWFILPDNSIRRVLPSRLPQHETAYAMTIHKSQGSEFERVLIVLPTDSSDLLTRELLYTGVTRARDTVEIWGSPEVIRRSVEARVKRNSGLAQKLYS